jgi:hypothetical protein
VKSRRRLSFFLVASTLLMASSGSAQQPPGRGFGGRGGGGAGTSAAAGPVNAYAYADCSASNTPVISIVVVTGAIPAAVPASVPQPSVRIVLHTPATQLATQQSITLSPDATKGGPNALALSCPVVGDCVPASAGNVSVQRAEDGALFGSYQATWPLAPPRTGRFTAAWRESAKKCG